MMDDLETALVLALCVRLLGTDKAVRSCCKRLVKQVPRNIRAFLFIIIDSDRPLEMAIKTVEYYDAY